MAGSDDTTLVTDSEQTFFRLGTEFGKFCERRKLRVNVGKSEILRCSRYVNGGRMYVRLNGD